jgi:hypothetical protein
MKKWILTFIVASALSFLFNESVAQSNQPDLYKTIFKLDSALFNAFNTCDIHTFQSMFSTDLEFYHDTGGLTDYNHTVNAIRTNCERKLGLVRTLIPGSLEVYPINGYGVIQIGSHQFCHPENGKQDCGTFKFVHIWKYADGQWKITRVVSYDH